jgi:hypothetical protein
VGRLAFGADVAGHAFTFADGLTDQRGAGATVEAMPYVSLSATRAYAEIHGGWRGHSLSHAGAAERRSVVETGARMGYDARAHLQGEARVVRAAEGTFSYAGLTVSHAAGALSAWARAGRWMSGTFDDAAWGMGAAYSLDVRSRIWASLQQEAPDPLYWNAPRRAWSVGLTRQLGRVPASPGPVPQASGGRVTIRVAAEDAPPGAIALGGSFNNWQPAPMRREGDFWVLTLPLAPGVYHYAFRAGADGWFVPDSVAGRRPDGMGGFTAVLVVL